MKEKSIDISIVVPIYNVDKYLDKCITLILESIKVSYELILVNDGCNDNSINICKEYSKKNERIKIVNKKNGGLSSARNAGINIALGKYIVFIDPDDEIDRNYFDRLFFIAEKNNCDVVVGGYKTFPEVKNKIPGYKLDTVLNGRDFILSSNNIHTNNDLCFVWRNIYRLQIIKDNNIRFNENVFIGEDVIFNLEVFLNCKRAYATSDILYNYRINNPNSLMRVKYKPNLESSLLIQYEIRKMLSEKYKLLEVEHYKKDMSNYYIKNIYFLIIRNLRNGEQKSIKENINKIVRYDMFRDSCNIIGFSYKCTNIKEYIYYLAVKFKWNFLILKLYERG